MLVDFIFLSVLLAVCGALFDITTMTVVDGARAGVYTGTKVCSVHTTCTLTHHVCMQHVLRACMRTVRLPTWVGLQVSASFWYW